MRYSPIHTEDGLGMFYDKIGEWVKFSDYQRLLLLADRLRRLDDEIHSRPEDTQWDIIERQAAEYAQCRKELTEETSRMKEHNKDIWTCPTCGVEIIKREGHEYSPCKKEKS